MWFSFYFIRISPNGFLIIKIPFLLKERDFFAFRVTVITHFLFFTAAAIRSTSMSSNDCTISFTVVLYFLK